jgi:hypothetical protein
MRRFGSAFFIASFSFFGAADIALAVRLFLRAHFAATPYTCQVKDWGKALSENDEIAAEQRLAQ